MTNDTKQMIINEIERKVDVFHKVSPIQYRIRCPICGDSQKDFKDSHCYIKCSFDPTEPLLYICFKCNAHGAVGKSFLKKLHMSNDVINLVGNQRYNRIGSYKRASVDIITGTPVLDSPQTEYIYERLGIHFTADDLDRFKIIWDMSNVYPYITEKRIRNTMPNNRDSISFLSDDKSTMLTRFFNDEMGRWRKIKLFQNDSKSFYTIKTVFDLFKVSEDGMPFISNVYIAEGIMDILSIYNYVGGSQSINNAFIATLGSDYIAGVDYAIAKGIMGKTVDLHVFIDNDIDEDSLRWNLSRYKWLFREITICRNMKFKDMGTTINNIKVAVHKV